MLTLGDQVDSPMEPGTSLHRMTAMLLEAGETTKKKTPDNPGEFASVAAAVSKGETGWGLWTHREG